MIERRPGFFEFLAARHACEGVRVAREHVAREIGRLLDFGGIVRGEATAHRDACHFGHDAGLLVHLKGGGRRVAERLDAFVHLILVVLVEGFHVADGSPMRALNLPSVSCVFWRAATMLSSFETSGSL